MNAHRLLGLALSLFASSLLATGDDKPAALADAPPIVVDLKNQPLRTVVATVANEAKLNYSYASGGEYWQQPVTISGTLRPTEIFAQLEDAVGLTVEESDGFITFRHPTDPHLLRRHSYPLSGLLALQLSGVLHGRTPEVDEETWARDTAQAILKRRSDGTIPPQFAPRLSYMPHANMVTLHGTAAHHAAFKAYLTKADRAPRHFQLTWEAFNGRRLASYVYVEGAPSTYATNSLYSAADDRSFNVTGLDVKIVEQKDGLHAIGRLAVNAQEGQVATFNERLDSAGVVTIRDQAGRPYKLAVREVPGR